MARRNHPRRWTTYTPVDEYPSGRRTSYHGVRRELAERERLFRKAPFSLYGLPPSRKVGRFLGGASFSKNGWRTTIHSLSLVHGVLVEGQGPMLVVESARPHGPGGGNLLRMVAEELWTGREESVVDSLAIFRRDRGHHDAGLSPLPSRQQVEISVSEEVVTLDVVHQPRHWVGRTEVEGCQLTIEGRDYRAEGLELIEIGELRPYILGTRRFESPG